MESYVTQQMQAKAQPAVARTRATAAAASWTTASTCAGFGIGHVSSLGHLSTAMNVTKPNPATGHRQPSETSP